MLHSKRQPKANEIQHDVTDSHSSTNIPGRTPGCKPSPMELYTYNNSSGSIGWIDATAMNFPNLVSY